MRINQIEEFNRIEGVDRPPANTENDKFVKWNNTSGYFDYEEIVPGDTNIQSDWDEIDSNEDSFILNKPTIPIGLDELTGDSDDISEGTTNLFLTTAERSKLSGITPGAGVNVNADWDAIGGAAEILNKPIIPEQLDELAGTLDDISEGVTNKHFNTTYKSNVDLNTAAKHNHDNKDELDLITDAGGGIIPTAIQIASWNASSGSDPEYIRDTVADFIQDTSDIVWAHDDSGDTFTPDIVGLSNLTTDDLAEGITNKYFTPSLDENTAKITLPAATSVAARVSAAVEGVDYPTGWVLSVSEVHNLLITHTLIGKEIAFINVFERGTPDRVLPPFSTAYSGFTGMGTGVIIEGLAIANVPLRIQLLFD